MTAAGLSFAAPARGPGWRWSASFLAALALHALLGVAFLAWRGAQPPSALAPAPILIDLPPVPAPPAPVREEPPKPLPEIEPPKPVTQEVQPPQPLKPPEPVAPPKPAPRPVHHRPTPQPPRPQPPAAHAATSEIVPPRPEVVAPAPVPAPPTPAAQQPAAGIVTFEALLAAHLDRYKRYPIGALRRGEEGTAYLRFVMDRQGHVLDYRIERSSGHVALDQEVLALIQRAQPLPAIPPNIADARLELVAPVRFFLK